ncbi:MAG: hypothetical protein OEM61_01085, partial [Desulfobacteraceae bacterium]|nr:hypothetical protein [Desulfobacteraceae bacterium]
YRTAFSVILTVNFSWIVFPFCLKNNTMPFSPFGMGPELISPAFLSLRASPHRQHIANHKN